MFLWIIVVHVVLIVVQCSGGTLHCGYLWFTMVHCGLLHNTEFSTVFLLFYIHIVVN